MKTTFEWNSCNVCRDHLQEGEVCGLCQKELAQGYRVRSLSGRLANAFEADHGTLFHALPLEEWVAFCGAKPGRRSAGWSEWGKGQDTTCKRCMSRKAYKELEAK